MESRTEPCSSRLLAPSPAIGHRFKAYGAPWRGRFGQLYVATIPQSLHPSPNRTSLRFFPVSPPDFTGSIRDSRCVLVSFRGCSETAVQMARRSKRAVHTTRWDSNIDLRNYSLSLFFSLFISFFRRSSFGDVEWEIVIFNIVILFFRKNYFWNKWLWFVMWWMF